MEDWTTIFLSYLEGINVSQKKLNDINTYLTQIGLIVTKREDYQKLCDLRIAINRIVDIQQ